MRYVIFLYGTQQLIPQKVLENYQYTQVGRYYPFWCSEQRGDSSRLPANHSPCHNLSQKFYTKKNNLNASSRSSRIMRSRLVSEIKIFLKDPFDIRCLLLIVWDDFYCGTIVFSSFDNASLESVKILLTSSAAGKTAERT